MDSSQTTLKFVAIRPRPIIIETEPSVSNKGQCQSESSENNELSRVNDITAKMDLAHYIVQMCKQKNKKPLRQDILEKAAHYTGLTTEKLVNIKKEFNSKCTFKEHSQLLKLIKPSYKCFKYDEIRQIIVDHYVKHRTLPTITSIVIVLQKKKDLVTTDRYILDAIVELLQVKGFVFKKIPNTKRYLIIENPQIFAKRMKYLQEMKKMRANGRSIVYIDWKQILFESHIRSCAIAASPITGLINLTFYDETPEVYLFKWLTTVVIPLLPKSSVLVFEYINGNMNIVPTPTSSKSSMINWLVSKDIPCDINMHRSELFTLIQKHKSTEQHKINVILNCDGYKVISRPSELQDLNYFKEVWARHFDPCPILENVGSKHSIYNYVMSLKLKDWEGFEKDIALNEAKYYDEDVQVENIVDKLLTMAKYGTISEADLGIDYDAKCHMNEEDVKIIIDMKAAPSTTLVIW